MLEITLRAPIKDLNHPQRNKKEGKTKMRIPKKEQKKTATQSPKIEVTVRKSESALQSDYTNKPGNCKHGIAFIVGQQTAPNNATIQEIRYLLHYYRQPADSCTVSACLWAYLLGEIRGIQKERAKRSI